MITPVDYDVFEYKLRYIFLKYLPKIFYPIAFKYFYKKKFNRELSLKTPERFSEKIIWSILHDKNYMKTILSDKLKVKEYVSKIIPELKYAQVYQVGSSFEDITFDKAPKSFVIKTNHAWKTGILVEDKSKLDEHNYNFFKKYYKNVLGINYAYWGTPELQYKKIKPKIFLEEYLHSKEINSYIKEYEVYCFQGIPRYINYSISRTCDSASLNIPENEKRDLVQSQIFDSEWKQANFEICYSNNLNPPNSCNRNLVLEYARILSKDFSFVRIDFLEVDETLYFGEFTFTPCSGFIEFSPDEYDYILGKMFDINVRD